MDFYRCENPDCGYVAEEEPDICPSCGGTFFTPLLEEDLTAGDWVRLGSQAVDQGRETDALACYQRAAAMDDPHFIGIGEIGLSIKRVFFFHDIVQSLVTHDDRI